MRHLVALLLALPIAGHAAEYMEKTPFQLSRAFSPGVITEGGKIVWVAGQTATRDNAGADISNNFEAQVKQVFSQIDTVLKRAGGSLANVVTMTVFIKESRYGDRFVEMRKDMFQNGNYPGSALVTVTNFARPGIEIEIQAVGVIGDRWIERESLLGGRHGKEALMKRAWLIAVLFLIGCVTPDVVPTETVRDIAPTGTLRAAINFGNSVLAQKEPLGGVSVDLARELARRLAVPLELVSYDAAGKVTADATRGAWDIAFVARDPDRAKDIEFTAPYVIIEGGYMVPASSPLQTIEEVDREGVRI